MAKWTVALVAGRATARCAAALLDKLIAEVPFRIEGIQVDGGSEFRAEFEDACRERNLCLFVLPPKRPRLTKPLAISPQPSTSQPSARRSPRLIWAELGHALARLGPLISALQGLQPDRAGLHIRAHADLDRNQAAGVAPTVGRAAYRYATPTRVMTAVGQTAAERRAKISVRFAAKQSENRRSASGHERPFRFAPILAVPVA